MTKTLILTAAFAVLTAAAHAQTSTETTCRNSGDKVICDSTTKPTAGARTDNGAFKTGFEAGSGKGGGLPGLIARKHRIAKMRDHQCRENGVGFHWEVLKDDGTEEEGICTEKQARPLK